MSNNNIGAFWKNEDKGYASGRVTCPHCANEFRAVIFENMMKKKSSHPDLNLLLSTRQEQKDGGHSRGGYEKKESYSSKPSYPRDRDYEARSEKEQERPPYEKKTTPYKPKKSIF